MTQPSNEPSRHSNPSPSREQARAWLSPRTRSVLQWVLVAVTLVFVWRELSDQWSELRAQARTLDPSWVWVIVASIIVLCTHAMLVQAWRLLLGGWDTAPPFWTSARIWTTANLGRYLPGKLWSIGALGILAGREGVSGVAAASAAVLGTLLNLGTGLGIAAWSGAGAFRSVNPTIARVAMMGAVLFGIGVILLPRLLPPIVDWVARKRGLPPAGRHISPALLWGVTAINALSWVGYGLAFAAFSRGVTPQVAGASAAFITVYTASYVFGYLVLFAPGGLGFREWALVTLMLAMGMSTEPEATILAVASRVWITVLEITPGLIALVLTRSPARIPVSRAD